MIFLSRSTLFTVIFFIALTGYDLIKEFRPDLVVPWVSMCGGVVGAYIMKVFEEQ